MRLYFIVISEADGDGESIPPTINVYKDRKEAIQEYKRQARALLDNIIEDQASDTEKMELEDMLIVPNRDEPAHHDGLTMRTWAIARNFGFHEDTRCTNIELRVLDV